MIDPSHKFLDSVRVESNNARKAIKPSSCGVPASATPENNRKRKGAIDESIRPACHGNVDVAGLDDSLHERRCA
jgi:hypothetical protein